jgi:hypothetical protein
MTASIHAGMQSAFSRKWVFALAERLSSRPFFSTP